MKPPKLVELLELNKSLRRRRNKTLRRYLCVAAAQWARISGDQSAIGYIRSKDWKRLYLYSDGLVSQRHDTAVKHFSAHQLAALIRKYPWVSSEIGTDPEGAALRSFHASEHRCKWMNRWALASYRRKADVEDPVIKACRTFIRQVIGSRPNLERIYRQCNFTAGASIGVHGNATNLMRKLQAERWSVSPSALPYFAAALCHNYHFATKVAKGNGVVQSLHVSKEDVLQHSDLVSYNKVEFVPKTAKTHRSIAVEPLGNGYLQKGVDLEFRGFLRRVGLDLSDQSKNQEFAREGSLDDSEEGFCTIDLSSASDSISLGVVKLLLPPAWFRFLDAIRSPSYRYRGAEKRYEKFCSMGNGFCFPLETLIFASVCHAVTGGEAGKDYLVYGDDIIVRRKAFGGTMKQLKRFGFKANVRKTFSEGPFRESCGGNWYRGEDVTPFTLDFELDDLSSLFKAINLSRRNSWTSFVLASGVRQLIRLIPSQWLFLRPFNGPPDTAIDFRDLQLPRNWGRSNRYQCPKWLELHQRPRQDTGLGPHPWVVNTAALRGHPSARPFVLRQSVEVRVREIARSGDIVPRSRMDLSVVHPDWVAPGW